MTRYAVAALRPEDHDVVYRFLSEEAYWSQGLRREIFDAAIKGSLCFAAYALTDGGGEQRLAGFARVVTDRATFAWLCDVFVLPEHRGNGVSKQLMDALTGRARPRASAELHARDARRARTVCAVRIRAARGARALDGHPPPLPLTEASVTLVRSAPRRRQQSR